MNDEKLEKLLKFAITVLVLQFISLVLIFIVIDGIDNRLRYAQTYTTVGDFAMCKDIKDQDAKRLCLESARDDVLLIRVIK